MRQTKAEVERAVDLIREVGFCVVPDVLPRDRCQEFRRVLGRLMRAEKGANLLESRHQRVMQLLAKDPVFVELLCSPFVLEI